MVTPALVAAFAYGCPGCETGRLARASVLDQDFWPTLGLIVLPVVIVIAAVTLVHVLGATTGDDA